MATPYRPIGGIGRGVPIRSDAVTALGGLTNNVSNFGAGNDSSNFGSGNQNIGANQGGFGGGNQTSGFRSYDFGSSNAGGSGSDRGNDSGKRPVWPKGKNRGPGGGHKANEFPNSQSGFGGDSGNVCGFGGGGTGQGGPRTCRKCNEEGHFARDCPNGDASGGGFGGGSRGFGGDDRGRSRGCFNCGEDGHMSKDCTQPRKPRNEGGRSGRGFNSGGGGFSSGGGFSGGNDNAVGGFGGSGFGGGKEGGEVSHSSLYPSGTAIHFMIDALNSTCGGGFSVEQLKSNTTLSPHHIRALNKEFKRLTVVSQVKPLVGEPYDQEYRVTEIMEMNANTLMYNTREFSNVPIAVYFKERYGELKFPKLQILRVVPQEPVGRGLCGFLPIELCRIKPCQRVNKKPQLADMTKASATTAPKVNAQMNRVEAQPPKTEYAEKEFLNVDTSKGALEQRQQKYYLAAGTQRIGAIIIDDNPDTTMYREFFGLLLETCREFGMQMPTMIQDKAIRQIPVACAAADLELRLEEFVEMGADLVIVTLPQDGSPLYAEVMGNYGVMTQCVMKPTIQETLQKLDRMMTGNLASEMNMKLGGIDSKGEAEAQAKKILEDKSTLILGIDVTYQGQLKKNAPPIATFVGNTDSSFMHYGASVRAHNRRVGVLYLQGQMRERLFEYMQGEGQLNEERKKVGLPQLQTKPQRIIIYRDGVAKGEFLQEILKTELVHVREACEMLGGSGYKPSITFIVAQKQKKPRGHGGNIWLGTVVDKAITHPTMFEFCLCSHIQGASRPIRYHVLTDDSAFTADNMQNLTFYLTHCFGLSTGPVSLPVPLYYADLASRRARIYLQDKLSAFSSDASSQSETGLGDAVAAISDEELIKGSAVTPSLKIKLDVD